MTSLVRPERDPDDLESLRARMASLEGALHQRRTDVARVESVLDAFKVRYRHEVGLLHEVLDELEHAIAEAESEVRASRPQPESWTRTPCTSARAAPSHRRR